VQGFVKARARQPFQALFVNKTGQRYGRNPPQGKDTYALFPITRDVTLAAHQARCFFLRDL